MKLSDVEGVVDKLIEKGAIPRIDHKKSYRYSYTRICQELDNLTVEDLPEHVDIFIGVCILENVSSALDPLTRQSVDHIWSKIYRTEWNSWKYISVGSINDHIRIYRETMNIYELSLLSSFIHDYGCTGDTIIYDIYKKAVISYAYNDDNKKTLIEIIQIMLQLMCIDILGDDILVDEAYTKQIVTKESYPWNFLSDIGIDIQDCFDIKNDIRDDLTLTIAQDIDLEPRDVECIKLRYIDMLTLSDIGTQLGVCGGRAQEIVNRAVRRIRQQSGRLNIIRNILYLYSDDICKQAFVKLRYPGFNTCGSLKVLHEIKEYKRVDTWRELVAIVEGNIVYLRSFRDGTFLGEIEKLIKITNRVAMEENTEATKVNVYAALALEELGLSVRSFNCLRRAGVNTVGDIISMTEEDFMHVRNLGKRSRDEIISAIEELGLKLKDSE